MRIGEIWRERDVDGSRMLSWLFAIEQASGLPRGDWKPPATEAERLLLAMVEDPDAGCRDVDGPSPCRCCYHTARRYLASRGLLPAPPTETP